MKTLKQHSKKKKGNHSGYLFSTIHRKHYKEGEIESLNDSISDKPTNVVYGDLRGGKLNKLSEETETPKHSWPVEKHEINNYDEKDKWGDSKLGTQDILRHYVNGSLHSGVKQHKQWLERRKSAVDDLLDKHKVKNTWQLPDTGVAELEKIQKHFNSKISELTKKTNDNVDELEGHLKGHLIPADQDQKNHIHSYSDDSSSLNRDLLQNGGWPSEHHDDMFDHLRAFIKKQLPAQREITTYSGLGRFNPHDAFKDNNGIVKMPAFTSSSIDPGVAGFFVDSDKRKKEDNPAYEYENEDNHVMMFRHPKGSNNGAYIGLHSNHEREKEFLIKPGMQWKIKKQHIIKVRTTPTYTRHVHIWEVEPHEG